MFRIVRAFGLLNDEIFPLRLIAIFLPKLLLGEAQLEFRHDVVAVPEHLHHRPPNPIQPRALLIECVTRHLCCPPPSQPLGSPNLLTPQFLHTLKP
jgi:hypothetical protein